jgi:hypothetical protein
MIQRRTAMQGSRKPHSTSHVAIRPLDPDDAAMTTAMRATLRYVERAVAAGVDARADVWMGMPHGFPANIGRLKAAEQAFDAMKIGVSGVSNSHNSPHEAQARRFGGSDSGRDLDQLAPASASTRFEPQCNHQEVRL